MRAANLKCVVSGQATVGEWEQPEGAGMWREVGKGSWSWNWPKQLAFSKAEAREKIEAAFKRKYASLQKQIGELETKQHAVLSAIESSDLPEGGAS